MKFELKKLKGGNKNMRKTGIVLAMVMFISVIAGGIALAQTYENTDGLDVNGADASLSVSGFAEISPDLDGADIVDVVDDIDASLTPSDKVLGFKKATIFHGYVVSESGERGAFVSATWAEQRFVRSSDISNEEIISKGRIKIGAMTFILERVDDANAEDLTMNFNILRGNSVVGKLDLRLDSGINPSFRIWNGDVEISGGYNEGEFFSGNLHGASRTYSVRDVSDEDRTRIATNNLDDADSSIRAIGTVDGSIDSPQNGGFASWIRGIFVRDKIQTRASFDADINAREKIVSWFRNFFS